jgi:hypothetical protein
MRMWREAVAVAVLAAAVMPAGAQLRPPEIVADLAGAADCTALVRELGRDAVWVGRYAFDGRTMLGATVQFDVAFCFRTPQACERFLNEVSLDYPQGMGSCRLRS